MPGVWVAGNARNLAANVVVAAAGRHRGRGASTPTWSNEDTRLAVERRRDPFSAAAESANCARLLGERRHGLTATSA